MTTTISRDDLAARIARDIPEGAVMNLGIGAPTRVADFLPPGLEVILHTENGMLGMGPAPGPGRIDPDLINAGKQPVTELPGTAYFHHADSFAIGAKEVYVMTDLFTRTGESKLVAECSYPLTGVGCVTRIYTDHAIFDVTADGLAVTELFGDNTVTELRELTGLDLVDATSTPADADDKELA